MHTIPNRPVQCYARAALLFAKLWQSQAGPSQPEERKVSENNPITVFASHVFEESDDYLRVFEFLESLDRFYYINVSKPENIPGTGGLQAIKDELIEQIKASEAIFVISSVYEQRPDIVKFIMDVAEANGKGMISIRPFGGVSETPAELLDRCQEHIEWNDREMADALLRQARGEETSRWEVLDFPGFDADGPTD
jgi:hypothetical protein